MKTKLLLFACTASLIPLSGLSTTAMAGTPGRLPASNPFAHESTLPFHAPDFAHIRDGDYLPAFKAGIARQDAEIRAIANNRATPTFANTIAAMERSGRLLDRVQLTFAGVSQANTDDTLQAVDTATAPLLAAHNDAIYLNERLFRRVKYLHDRIDRLRLTPEQHQLLQIDYAMFVHAGAELSPAKQARLKALNTQLSSLESAFQQKLLAAAKAGALVVDDPKALAGLSPAQVAAAAEAAKARGLAGKYVLPLQNTTQQPALASLDDRATRAALFEHSWMRAERGDANDTRDTIATIAKLRAEKAALFGLPNWASYVLYDQMAKTPATAKAFLDRLVPAITAKEHAEAADIQAQIRKDGESFDLKPWDWDKYAEEVRKARYDLDDAEVKPYFVLDRVLTDGVFYAANQLYGLTFKERHDIPVYQPDVRVFTVYDKDGSELGLMYFDYFKRDNKAGGAWMSNFVNQSHQLGTKPVIYNVANFTKPAPGQPALISFDDVTTMFHEFGHALHGLFANEEYASISGANTARDFVEFPSQFNENWALYPQVLHHYAFNYKTGAPIPDTLVAKILKARTFNQGYALGEAVTAAEMDLAWHSLPADAPKQDVDAFEAKALAATGLDTTDVPPRYRSSYFLHIWANGYSAGYYAYAWTEMLDHDAFQWFMDHGGLTRANGQRFRDMILSRGHTMDYATMFRNFTGHDPSVAPMIRFRGLEPTAN